VAVAGLEDGWGEEFSRALYRAQFAEGRQVGDPQIIGEIVDALGQNGAAALGARRIRRHQTEAARQYRGRRSASASSARRASSRPVNCSGAMTGWSRALASGAGNVRVGKARAAAAETRVSTRAPNSNE
jgi:hypothetical protein